MKRTPWILIGMLFLTSCALQPLTWQPATPPPFDGAFSLNNKLTQSKIISLDGWYGPEEFTADIEGNVYCGVHIGPDDFSRGAILKLSPDGKLETWLETEGWVALAFDTKGNLIALIHGQGLVEMNAEKEMKILVPANHPQAPAMMGSGLQIASDGTIYFATISGAETASPDYINQLILENRPTGGVYAYDPSTDSVQVISEGHYFGNGLALTDDEQSLLLSETSRYRILKIWLDGPKTGQKEIWADNLPGFPNNISPRENGTYWIGFTTRRNAQLDAIHPKKGMKKLVFGLPDFLKPKADKFGMVLAFDQEGDVVEALFDTTGTVIPEAGAAREINGKLYLGGDVVGHIGQYDLIPAVN